MDFENILNRKTNIAIITTEGTTYSYEKLDDCQKQLAKQIHGRSLVFLVMENEPESVIGYVSCLINNCVAFPLPKGTDKDTFEQWIEAYLPNYIWISKTQWEQWKSKKKNYKKCFSMMKYILLRRKETAEIELHPDLTIVIPTPDTKSSSRVVRLSERNVASGARLLCEQWQLTEQDRAIISISNNCFYSLSVITALLSCGGSIVLAEENTEQTFLSVDGQRERLFVQTKELMPKPKEDELDTFEKEIKGRFYIMSVCSEMATWISCLTADSYQAKPDSAGTAIPDSEIVIIDEFSNTVFEPNKEGEIVSVGSHVSMGYATDCHTLNEEDYNSSILYTGIMGYLDEEGYLYVTGRKEDTE